MLAVSVFSRRLPEEVMVARILGVMGLIAAGVPRLHAVHLDPFERLLPAVRTAAT